MTNFPPPDAEHELSHLRDLRAAVLDVLSDPRLIGEQKLEAIERIFSRELDEEEQAEEVRDQERLS